MIQMWTRDEVPGLTRSGGDALAGGIVDAGHSLAQGLSAAIDRKKKEGQLSQSLRKTLSILKPERKPEFDAMSLGDLQGESQAIAIQSHLAEQKGRQEEQQARTQTLQQSLKQHLAEQAVPGAILGGAQAGVPFPLNDEHFEAATSAQSGLSPAAMSLLRGYNQAGAALPAGAVDDLMRNGAGGKNAFFSSSNVAAQLTDEQGKPLPGFRRAVTGPNASQIIGDPTSGLATQSVIDEDGNPHTFVVPPRGAPQQVKPPASNEAHSLLHPGTGEPIPGWVVINGKPMDVRTIMEKAGLGKPAAAPAAAPSTSKPGATNGNPLLVKTRAEAEVLPNGTWFRTPDGRVIQRKR